MSTPSGAPLTPGHRVRGSAVIETDFKDINGAVGLNGWQRTIVHLLNHASSWGLHSIYQKLAPLPEELRKELGHPDSLELRGTWPIREEVIPLHDFRVTWRVPGVTKATLQPGNVSVALRPTNCGVEVVVPKLEMHSMVIFE